MEAEPSRMLRFPEVAALTGMSRRTIYRAMRAGEFPQCVKLRKHGRAVGWPSDKIAAYLAAQQTA